MAVTSKIPSTWQGQTFLGAQQAQKAFDCQLRMEARNVDTCGVQMIVYRYNEEEWENVIVKDPDWSREETDYLLSLCDQLELRFLTINDRYEVTALFPIFGLVSVSTADLPVHPLEMTATAFQSCENLPREGGSLEYDRAGEGVSCSLLRF